MLCLSHVLLSHLACSCSSCLWGKPEIRHTWPHACLWWVACRLLLGTKIFTSKILRTWLFIASPETVWPKQCPCSCSSCSRWAVSGWNRSPSPGCCWAHWVSVKWALLIHCGRHLSPAMREIGVCCNNLCLERSALNGQEWVEILDLIGLLQICEENEAQQESSSK